MTSISGELLDAMTHHTILADAVGGAFVAPEAYDSRMAMEGAWACSQSGLGRAAFSGRILKTLGKRSHAEVQSYLLGAALALDVQAMEAFLPDQPEEIPMPDNVIPLHRNLGAAHLCRGQGARAAGDDRRAGSAGPRGRDCRSARAVRPDGRRRRGGDWAVSC